VAERLDEKRGIGACPLCVLLSRDTKSTLNIGKVTNRGLEKSVIGREFYFSRLDPTGFSIQN
jgi:hypothetical protein